MRVFINGKKVATLIPEKEDDHLQASEVIATFLRDGYIVKYPCKNHINKNILEELRQLINSQNLYAYVELGHENDETAKSMGYWCIELKKGHNPLSC